MVESKVMRLRRRFVETNLTLPHELVVDILSRLPLKYLWPFRYVCNTWFKLLTTDNHFAKLHFENSIKSHCNPSILAAEWEICEDIPPCFNLAIDYASCDEAIHLHLPFHSPHHSMLLWHISGICNGLVCVADDELQEIYIWNPVTEDHITIPYSPVPSHFSDDHDRTVGFGMQKDTEEYKVISFCSSSELSGHDSSVQLWTLGVDVKWRTLELEDDISYVYDRVSVLLNGALHWHGKMGAKFVGIVAFNLKEEVFKEIPLPNDIEFNDTFLPPKIGELDGFLCIYTLFYGSGVDIWAMMEYGTRSSWTKRFRIEGLEPLGVVPQNGEVIVKANGRGLILYNPNTNSVSDLKDFGFTYRGADMFMFMFLPSIISPKVISNNTSGPSIQ